MHVLEKITAKKCEVFYNGSLEFHTKNNNLHFKYKIRYVNRHHVNLDCSHRRRGCQATLQLKTNFIQTAPIDPDAPKKRWRLDRENSPDFDDVNNWGELYFNGLVFEHNCVGFKWSKSGVRPTHHASIYKQTALKIKSLHTSKVY